MTDRGPYQHQHQPLYHHSHAHAYASPSYGGGSSGANGWGHSGATASTHSSSSSSAALLPHPHSGHAPRQLQPHAHAYHSAANHSSNSHSNSHSHSHSHSNHSHSHAHSHSQHQLQPHPHSQHHHAPAPSAAQYAHTSHAHGPSHSHAVAAMMAPPPPPPPPPPAPAPGPVNPAMAQAVEHATHWWANQLKKHAGKPVTVFSVSLQAGVKTKHTAVKPLSVERVELFRRALVKELVQRYDGHWYEDDVQRGSGYRSISYDSRVDTVLRRAARSCGLDNLEKLLAPARFHVMFVNPGEVKVLNTVLMSSDATYVWQNSPNAAPPPLLPLQSGPATTLVLTSATPTKAQYKAAGAAAAAGAAGATLALAAGKQPKSKLSPHASPFGAAVKPPSNPSSPPPGAGAAQAGPAPSSQTPPRSHSTSPVLPPANGAATSAAGSPVLTLASGVVNPSAALLQAQAAQTAQLVGVAVNTPPLSPPLSPPLPAAARTSGPGAGAVDRQLTVSPPPVVSASAVLTIKQMLSTIVDRVSTETRQHYRPHSQSEDSTAAAPGTSTPGSPPSGDSTPIQSPSNAAGGVAPFGTVPPPPLVEQTA